MSVRGKGWIYLKKSDITAIVIAQGELETYISAVGDEDPSYESLAWAAKILEDLLERLGEPKGWRAKARELQLQQQRQR